MRSIIALIIFLIIMAALLGVLYIERAEYNHSYLRTVLWLLGVLSWIYLTYTWWADKLLDKIFKR